MHITILTIGSRGDVQPYLALGVGLAQAGYQVRLASHAMFESWIRSYGLDFALVRFNPQDVVNHPDVQRAKSNIFRFMLTVRRIVGPQFAAVFDDFWKACQGSQAIIASPSALNAFDCAEALSLPLFIGLLQPLIPTRSFPSFFLPPLPNLGGTFNLLTHRLFEQLLWQSFRAHLNRWRKARLERPRAPFFGPYAQMRKQHVIHILGYSPSVIPKPSDWKAWHHVTGYWFLDSAPDWQPSASLDAFLHAGAPPVYVGFGSMRDEQPEALTNSIIDALERTGQRGILATGWGALNAASLPETIFLIDDVPHQWLFPRMAAHIHHGGAGTTAASLRCGVPSIIIPFGGDQYHWSQTLVGLGVSPKAPAVNKLTADALANAIHQAINDQDLRNRAKSLGRTIRSEDGVSRAVEIVHQHLTSGA